jgi:hypothetical protein
MMTESTEERVLSAFRALLHEYNEEVRADEKARQLDRLRSLNSPVLPNGRTLSDEMAETLEKWT